MSGRKICKMISVEEAFSRIVSSASPLSTEKLATEQCSTRVLAAPILSRRNQPSAHLSAMDGYAIIADDLDNDGLAVSLSVVGESAAGKPFTGSITTGEAVRIFTGAVVPGGANQVVIQENAERSSNTVLLKDRPAPFRNIRKMGIDFATGEEVLPKGTFLTPKSIGLAASAGHNELMVYRQPKVAILATGDELVSPDAKTFEAGDTVDSVRPQLFALLQQAGADIDYNHHAPDEKEAIEHALKQCESADILITVGGASVGDKDFVQEALTASGMKLDFWKLAMRPGKPLIHGKRGDQHVLGLPGNPISAFVCALLFARPLVDQMMGRPAPLPQGVLLPTSTDLPQNGPRAHYMRGQLVGEPGKRSVEPASSQDSSLQSVLAKSDGLLVRPPNAAPVRAGDLVPFLPF